MKHVTNDYRIAATLGTKRQNTAARPENREKFMPPARACGDNRSKHAQHELAPWFIVMK
ncbi:hypothetical protein [Duganella sp. LjRoot269]|jgi:hypothetical protein|uniref:hypothetical protein n=1 Tax=Duganella sp. LjRoot269 TaxID=3342305 RepID=UPI003ED0B566